MRIRILYFILVIVQYIAFSCKNDDFKETKVVFSKPVYTAKIGDYDTIYANFTNGTNNKYILDLIINNSPSDTNIAVVISKKDNYAIIKHTTIGSKNVYINYYAKGQLISKDTAIVTTTKSGIGSNNAGKIFFVAGGGAYFINSNGTGKVLISNSDYATIGCLNNNSNKFFSNNYTSLDSYNIVTEYNDASITLGTAYPFFLNSTVNNYLSVNYSTFSRVYYSDINGDYERFYAPTNYTGSLIQEFYLQRYDYYNTSSVFAIISKTTSSTYDYYIDYYDGNSNKTSLFNKSFKSSASNFTKVKISANKKYLAVIDNDVPNNTSSIKVYNLESNQLIGDVFTKTSISDFQFSKDETKIVASAYPSSSVSYYDLFVFPVTGGGTSTNITNTSNISEMTPDWK